MRVAVVAVRPGAATEAYRSEWATTCAEADLPDWLPEHPILHAQQQIRFAGLLRVCGDDARADELLEQASAHADHPAVARDLARWSDS